MTSLYSAVQQPDRRLASLLISETSKFAAIPSERRVRD